MLEYLMSGCFMYKNYCTVVCSAQSTLVNLLSLVNGYTPSDTPHYLSKLYL
jgi:hypothetical protein